MKNKINIGDYVWCSESGVRGTVIKIYKPTACEEQIMVETDDGQKYHAPISAWRLYQFGKRADRIIVDEISFLNKGEKL